MGWRDLVPVHPAADLFPMMSESELRELGEDIKKHGGLVQAVHLYKGKLLDGRNRLDAMELVGFTFDDAGLNGLAHNLDAGVDPYAYVIAANLHRRHLTAEQKRDLIAKVLKAKPKQSNRKIAKQTKADHKTVAAVRDDLESTGEIPQLEKTTGADGKQRKSRAKKMAEPTSVPDQRATESAEISEEQRRAEYAALDDPIEEESAPGLTAKERWQNSIGNMAGEAISLQAYWTREFGEWEKLGARHLITLALQAAEAWSEIADRLEDAAD